MKNLKFNLAQGASPYWQGWFHARSIFPPSQENGSHGVVPRQLGIPPKTAKNPH